MSADLKHQLDVVHHVVFQLTTVNLHSAMQSVVGIDLDFLARFSLNLYVPPPNYPTKLYPFKALETTTVKICLAFQSILVKWL